jgi:hypothetical protein
VFVIDGSMRPATRPGSVTDATRAPAQVDADEVARDRLLAALQDVTAGRDPEDPVVAAVEPVVAFCKGWREAPAIDDWLDALAATPDVLVLRVRDPADGTAGGRGDDVSGGRPVAYVRNRDGWLVVASRAGRLRPVERVDRSTVRDRLAGAAVDADAVDGLDPRVRWRFVEQF